MKADEDPGLIGAEESLLGFRVLEATLNPRPTGFNLCRGDWEGDPHNDPYILPQN